MPLIFWHGQLLFRNNQLAMDLRCCCTGTCCGRNFPPGPTPLHYSDTMNLTLTDVTDCPCINGIVIPLTWSGGLPGWSGTGPGGACALLNETWVLRCGQTCGDWELDMLGPTACVLTPDPVSANDVGCSCNPVSLAFSGMDLTGVGCCDGDISGAGSISATIAEA